MRSRRAAAPGLSAASTHPSSAFFLKHISFLVPSRSSLIPSPLHRAENETIDSFPPRSVRAALWTRGAFASIAEPSLLPDYLQSLPSFTATSSSSSSSCSSFSFSSSSFSSPPLAAHPPLYQLEPSGTCESYYTGRFRARTHSHGPLRFPRGASVWTSELTPF